MPRIKKQGLDYFPLNTDFIHSRLVRRLLKSKGDGALTVLINVLSCIYSDKGYYVHTDDLFYDDIAADLFDHTAKQVRTIVELAAEYGIFDHRLLQEKHVLTSADIQRQYLFSTKRRRVVEIDEEYRLITDNQEDATNNEAAAPAPSPENDRPTADESVTFMPQNATLTPQNVTSGTHSIAQHSIAQHSIENLLPNSSSQTGGTTDGGRMPPEEMRREDTSGKKTATAKAGRQTATAQTRPQAPREWTQADIDRLQPPTDHVPRNLEGLILSLRELRISPQEQYAIILKSNFGVIGHPMWKGFGQIRASHGKIRKPGLFLLSLCHQADRARDE